jgi:hypothetical protein
MGSRIGGAMKRLLFAVGCLLLLLAAAVPASAADKIQWQVIVGPHWSGEAFIVYVNYTDMTFGYLDEDDNFFTSVPADATDVVVGDPAAFVNRGNLRAFVKSYFQEMTVDDPDGNRVIDVDRTECHDYWGPMYHYNDFLGPDGPLLPYNPRIGAGMWERDWWLRLPLNSGGKLTPGSYTVTYNSMLTHRCADPMWLDRGAPGGEGYPPIGGPSDWWDEPGTLTFYVGAIE